MLSNMMSGKMASKIQRNPSPYPRVLFHLIRLGQFVSSVIVMSILAFFVHYLMEDKYYIPWTFIVLLSVSSFTNISVFVTAFFYHYRTLTPRLSAYINIFLTGLWFFGFALLTWYISHLLGSACIVANWEHETGVMVCRMYKALETFCITGMLFTAGSLALDFSVVRASRQRGVYNQMDDNQMNDVKRSGSPQNRADDEFSAQLMPGDTQPFAPRDASFEIQHPAFAHTDAQKPYKTQQAYDFSSATRAGYAQPTMQTSYEGAGARLDRDFEREGA